MCFLWRRCDGVAVAPSPGHSQILSRSLRGCEIKSGSGLGTGYRCSRLEIAELRVQHVESTCKQNPCQSKVCQLSHRYRIARKFCVVKFSRFLRICPVTRKLVPRTDFGCQKWSPRTTFGCQPILPKLVLAGPNLATKIGPGDYFWQLKVVPQTSLGCYEWSCFPILTVEKAE